MRRPSLIFALRKLQLSFDVLSLEWESFHKVVMLSSQFCVCRKIIAVHTTLGHCRNNNIRANITSRRREDISDSFA